MKIQLESSFLIFWQGGGSINEIHEGLTFEIHGWGIPLPHLVGDVCPQA